MTRRGTDCGLAFFCRPEPAAGCPLKEEESMINGVWIFIANSILLGAGLAMDAFSVSMANGLRDPGMETGENFRIAGTFAFFQFLMPLTGWFCVHTILTYFTAFQKCIPWIALLLLGYIGGKMLLEGLRGGPEMEADSGQGPILTSRELAVQGIATSIDALSVGFAISEYSTGMAFAAALIIGTVTLAICLGGLKIGRKMGTVLAGKASILGGVILIAIGLEIFISNMF